MLASIQLAKEILQKDQFGRLATVDGLAKQKESALGVVEALERIANAGLSGAGAKQDIARIKQWHQLRKAALQAKIALGRSANTKLVLNNLFLGIN